MRLILVSVAPSDAEFVHLHPISGARDDRNNANDIWITELIDGRTCKSTLTAMDSRVMIPRQTTFFVMVANLETSESRRLSASESIISFCKRGINTVSILIQMNFLTEKIRKCDPYILISKCPRFNKENCVLRVPP